MTIICSKCKKPLKEPGALLFSPAPASVVIRGSKRVVQVETLVCTKRHLCVSCYEIIVKVIHKGDES